MDMSLNFLRLCHAQTCGKCAPCRIGLGQLTVLIERVLDRTAALETKGVRGFREDYEEHILHGRCICGLSHPVPCVSTCPAHVDIPGYVALVREGRYRASIRSW